jgi:hypothetical protein
MLTGCAHQMSFTIINRIPSTRMNAQKEQKNPLNRDEMIKT